MCVGFLQASGDIFTSVVFEMLLVAITERLERFMNVTETDCYFKIESRGEILLHCS